MNVKLLLASLFILTLVLGVAGVLVYYESLKPLRLVASCTNVSSVMDKVKYLQYNATDESGTHYIVKVTNNPSTRSGTVELYVNGTKTETLKYKYGERLESLTIYYSNGTVRSVKGLQVYSYEDMFYTSINLKYNSTTGAVRASIFPGIGPLYGICFVSKATDVNWDYYASLRKPRSMPLQPMKVDIGFGKTNFQGEKLDSVVVKLSRNTVSLPNKWFLPIYTAEIVDYHGVPVAVYYQVAVYSTNYVNTIAMQTMSIQTVK